MSENPEMGHPASLVGPGPPAKFRVVRDGFMGLTLRMSENVPVATLKCKAFKHPFCGPIFLPYPNLPEKSACPPDWPRDDWRAYVQCHECGAIALFEKRDIRWEKVPRQSDTERRVHDRFHRVSLKCNQPSCESQIEILTVWPKNETKFSIEARLSDGAGDLKCANGHNLDLPVVVAKTQWIADL